MLQYTFYTTITFFISTMLLHIRLLLNKKNNNAYFIDKEPIPKICDLPNVIDPG
jgi:hypothetical protein